MQVPYQPSSNLKFMINNDLRKNTQLIMGHNVTHLLIETCTLKAFVARMET